MKGCSTSLVNKEMPVKTMVRYHFSGMGVGELFKSHSFKCCQECKEKELA